MKKALIAIAAAATFGAATLAAPQSAEARCYGCAVGAGIIGGLAAGAILGSALNHPYPYYYGPGYYYAPGPVYYRPSCYWTGERFWNGYGWQYHRVRVCN